MPNSRWQPLEMTPDAAKLVESINAGTARPLEHAPAGLSNTRRKYFTRDMLPLEHGVRVKYVGDKYEMLTVGKIVSHRTQKLGNGREEWEYHVRNLNGRTWWVPASTLLVMPRLGIE